MSTHKGIGMFINRDEAVDFWERMYPTLQCDFILNIDNGLNVGRQYVGQGIWAPVISFTMPDSGVNFNYVNPMTGHVAPSINVNPFTITFAIPQYNADRIYSPSGIYDLVDLWKTQYNNEGNLVFNPVQSRPVIKVLRLKGEPPKFEPIISSSGCMFTYPKPNVNYGSTELAAYNISVYYEDIEMDV